VSSRVGPLLVDVVALLVMPCATLGWLLALAANDRAPALPTRT
jgi:hypothetical protein